MKKISLIFTFAIVLMSCRNAADKAEVFEDKQETIDSMKVEMEKQNAELARQKSIDSMKAVVAAQEKNAKPIIVNNAAPVGKQRKQWSGAAKGAVIGAGVGAITGAAVSKKKGEGAIIGGLAGAGVGAGAGAIIDSEKKKKEENN